MSTDHDEAADSEAADSEAADSEAADFEVRRIQPYQARKPYQCPGCNQRIDVGLGHLVVVPRLEPDLRRHWHLACWEYRHRRRPR